MAVTKVFASLARIQAQLNQDRYLTGDQFTEADLRLFSTLDRFDAAYHNAFKCNIRRLIDRPQPVGLCARDLPDAGAGWNGQF